MLKKRDNPLLFEKFDPTFPLEKIEAPTVVQRKSTHKREIRDLRRKQTAAEAIDGFDHDTEFYGFTKGQFSVIDLIEAAIQYTGPVNMTFSTWTAAKVDISSVIRFVESGHCKTARFLVDLTFQRRSPELAKRIRDTFGADSIRVGKNHAKFFMLRNDEWSVICQTSMNLNFNPRFENFNIRHDPDLCDFHSTIFDEIWKKQTRKMADQKACKIEQHFNNEM